MTASKFYDAGPIAQIAINLFYGWGYNFYRKENQLRADDQLIRGKVSWLLGLARASVESAETDYRREFLPAPSRAKPQPDPAAVADAQELERLSRALGELEGQIRNQPVPESDRMAERYRQEAETLVTLANHDQQLVGQSELLRTMLDQQSGAAIIKNLPAIKEGLAAIGKTLQARQASLL